MAITFEQLLHPLTFPKFCNEHWERSGVLLEPIEVPQLEGFPRISRLLEMIRDRTLIAGRDFTLVSETAPFPANFHEPPGGQQILDAFHTGNTIKVTNSCQHFSSLASLVGDLESHFHCWVSCNLYLTPPRSRGLPPHFDTHDVFVLQLDGTKQWQWFDQRMQYPTDRHQYAEISAESIRDCAKAFSVRPGDAFYMPRGLVHQANCLEEASLHATLGVRVATWKQLIEAYVEHASHWDESLRAGIPPGSLFSKDGLPDLQQRMRVLFERLAQGEHLESAVKECADQQQAKRQGKIT